MKKREWEPGIMYIPKFTKEQITFLDLIARRADWSKIKQAMLRASKTPNPFLRKPKRKAK